MKAVLSVSSTTQAAATTSKSTSMPANLFLAPYPFYAIIYHTIISSYAPSLLLLNSDLRRLLGPRTPSGLLVALRPIFLNIAKRLLHVVHYLCVAGVLADVVADLDRRRAVCGGELDDDVERDGFLAGGEVCEIV